MKNMKNPGSIVVIAVSAVASILFFAASASCAALAADFGIETQNLITRSITRAIEANINNAATGDVSVQPMIREIQNSMMTKISDAVKQDTAVRKRAAVIETCMECRAMQPIELVVSGKSTFLDADIQERINQAMAKRITETIRVISSDPAVAGIVQERMMTQRMTASPLRQEMQPFIMSRLLSDPEAINVTDNTVGKADRSLAQASCPDTDSRFPNC